MAAAYWKFQKSEGRASHVPAALAHVAGKLVKLARLDSSRLPQLRAAQHQELERQIILIVSHLNTQMLQTSPSKPISAGRRGISVLCGRTPVTILRNTPFAWLFN